MRARIDGMIVRVADERFIIPTLAIEQSLRPERSQISLGCRQGSRNSCAPMRSRDTPSPSALRWVVTQWAR